MVQYCVAYGCKNIQDPRKAVSFHSFPFKRPEILELWIKALRREDWQPSKWSRICGEHFLSTDFQIRPGSNVKVLKPDAVPSKFSFPKHLLGKLAPRRKLQRKINEPMEIDLRDMPSTSKKCQERTVSCGTQTSLKSMTKIKLLQKKVKSLREKVKRRDVKISNMKDVISELSRSGCSNENLDNVLKNYFEGLPLELVMLQNTDTLVKDPGQRRYSPLMRQFAHTLYFYSQKAYNFLRQHFILPNGRTIRKWLQSVNCEPGILQEVLDFLKKEVKEKGYLKNCALILDSMSIRKQMVWDHSRGMFVGNVNYGKIIDVDFEMPASEALFLQIVSYTTKWKCPVAYFLINKLDANVQTQLIKTCLRSLYEHGIIIRSITSDGAHANIATYKNLSCKITCDKIVPYFDHPSLSTIKVYCMLDPCHMLKLARNAFAEKCLQSEKGKISWQYVVELDNLQEKEQLRLANSLTSYHVNFKNKIMNVKLAAQAISSGVADAIEFLQKSGIKEFQGSSATIEFIKMIDRLFDMLNCRNPYGKGFKAPIRPSTLHYTEEVFAITANYFKSLSIDGLNLLLHNRKIFVLGFLLTMQSTIALAKDLFEMEKESLKYFLTYKFSQDHLELFFSCIRSRGGWNNNPNCQQLKWALRQLLFKNSITGSINANCNDFGEYFTPAFELRSEMRQKENHSHNEEQNEGDIELNELANYLDEKKLSYFQENVLYYISGYIVRKLLQNSTCSHCEDILLYKEDVAPIDHSYAAPKGKPKIFTSFVTRGGLLYACNIIYKIVSFVEKQFRLLLEQGNLFKNNKTNIKKQLSNSAIQYFSEKINWFLPKHPINSELYEELHEFQIIKKKQLIFS